MTRKIGVAIIGLGPASQPHSQSLADLADRVDVRWAVSRSAERTKAYSEPISLSDDQRYGRGHSAIPRSRRSSCSRRPAVIWM